MVNLHMVPCTDYDETVFARKPVGWNVRYAMWLWLLIFCGVAYAAPCPAGQTKDEDALVQIEKTWANSLEQRDAAALGCILADEFQDTDPQGSVFDRNTTLVKAANHRPVHHELQELRAHVYGDFGYIRGLATAVDASGKVVAKVRFTDIYVYRDQRWQAVAAHESMLPGTP
ncbi:MAG: nuclear transport factor 2 family protein [Candidatus Sulfotelmatobacter sp.]|nr:nuclear transport factor 2 family protein [Candidatus Sulfotelmatobacter sp.]